MKRLLAVRMQGFGSFLHGFRKSSKYESDCMGAEEATGPQKETQNSRKSEILTKVIDCTYEAGKKVTKHEFHVWYENEVKLAFAQIVETTLNENLYKPLKNILDGCSSQQVCDEVRKTLESELERSQFSHCMKFVGNLILDQALNYAREIGTLISCGLLVKKCISTTSRLKEKSAMVVKKVESAVTQLPLTNVNQHMGDEELRPIKEEIECAIQLNLNKLRDEALQSACSREMEICSQVMTHVSNPKKVSKKNNLIKKGTSRAEMKTSSCKANWQHLVATGLQRRMICEGLAAEDLPRLAVVENRPCKDLNLWMTNHQRFLILYSCMENSSPGVLEKIRNSDLIKSVNTSDYTNRVIFVGTTAQDVQWGKTNLKTIFNVDVEKVQFWNLGEANSNITQ
eukprot:PhF_6_TR37493/c1_g1_i1/m.55324